MFRSIIRVTSVVMGVAFATSVSAATFEYRTVATIPDNAPRTCFLVDSSTDVATDATSDCTSSNGKVSALASSGADGLRAGATVTGFSEDGDSVARGTAYLFDELSFSVDSGIFRIGVNISGEISLTSDNYAYGYAGLDIASYNLANLRTPHEIFSHEQAYFSHLGTYVDNLTGSYGMNYVDIAFTDGYLKLDAVLGAKARCDLFVTAPNCSASSDFLSTAVFMGGSIFDMSGTQIDGATITSASGTDYLGDESEPSVVPLPASLPLVLAAFGMLGFVKRRRKF